MTDKFLIPTGRGGAIQPSEQMRRDAAASVAGIEARGGPYLYGPANADAKVITEFNQAQAGDFVIGGIGDKFINIGKSPKFIVLSQHKRHALWTGEGKDRTLVWDVARDAMTDGQAHHADLDWSDPRAAKPYDSYMLLHVEDGKVDPHGAGPMRFSSKAHTAKASKQWLSGIKGHAARGLPMWAQVWQLTGHLADTGHGSQKFTFGAGLTGAVDSNHPLYEKLKQSWQHAQEMLKQAKSSTYSDDTAALEAQADARAQPQIEDGPADHLAQPRDTNAPVQQAPEGDYAQPGVGGYDDYAPPEKQPAPEPSMDTLPPVPPEAAKLGMNYTTPILVSKDEKGNRVKAASIDMEQEQAKSAASLAMPHEQSSPEARAVLKLIRAVCGWRGWNPESLGFPPFVLALTAALLGTMGMF